MCRVFVFFLNANNVVFTPKIYPFFNKKNEARNLHVVKRKGTFHPLVVS